MLLQKRGWLAPVLLSAWLLVPGSAGAGINDDAGFFSEKVKDKAESDIVALHQKYKHDLAIETFAQIPADRLKEYKADEKGFMAKWARERARQLKETGIYILICKDPAHLEVEVGNNTQNAGFSPDERKALRDKLLVSFKKKEYDKGLSDAVEYVSERYAVHFEKRSEVPSGTGGSSHTQASKPGVPGVSLAFGGLLGIICIGLVAVLGIWLVIGVIRALTRPSGGYGGGPGYGGGGGGYGGGPGYGGGYGGGGYGGGGGGGFMSSLFGGMFGAAAGNWAYDSIFRGSGRSSPSNYDGGYGGQTGGGMGGTAGNGSTGADYSAQQPDTDYSGSGGDFGDNSGGADAGGADAGGGDFGGGDAGGLGGGGFFSDSGGGGDFGGGGGGDYGGGGGDSGGGGDF